MVVTGAGNFCNTNITASGGSGGTIYFEGTTSNGNSPATPSTSETITSTGTYYFRAHPRAVAGTEGSAVVTIDVAPTQPMLLPELRHHVLAHRKPIVLPMLPE